MWDWCFRVSVNLNDTTRINTAYWYLGMGQYLLLPYLRGNNHPPAILEYLGAPRVLTHNHFFFQIQTAIFFSQGSSFKRMNPQSRHPGYPGYPGMDLKWIWYITMFTWYIMGFEWFLHIQGYLLYFSFFKCLVIVWTSKISWLPTMLIYRDSNGLQGYGLRPHAMLVSCCLAEDHVATGR